jgi:cytochrome c biogenesis protein CcdA
VSVVVGLALAVAYHFLSVGLQGRLSRYSAALLPLVFVVGFLIRLVLLGAVLVVVALWTPLNIVAVALCFIGLFTVLTGIWLYRIATKGRKTRPPADGAPEVPKGDANAS